LPFSKGGGAWLGLQPLLERVANAIIKNVKRVIFIEKSSNNFCYTFIECTTLECFFQLIEKNRSNFWKNLL
jgi:hypothetical protein